MKNFFGALLITVGLLMVPYGVVIALVQHDNSVWIAGLGTLIAVIGAAIYAD